MSKSETSMYVKFSYGGNKNLPEGFSISEEIGRAQSWNRENVGDIVTSDLYNFTPDNDSPFSKLGNALVARTDVFRKTTPFLMSRLPDLIGETIEARFKKFIAKHGSLIEKDDQYELFEINKKLLATQENELNRLRALLAGGDQLPSLFLIGLISAYDSFVSDLMRCVLISRPEIISSSDKNISFKDLIELGSIEAARQRLIDREIDTTMRGSHLDQALWIEKKSNVNIIRDNKLWPKFIEVCERRNLFTHTSGIVSQQYKNVCKENGLDVDEKVGDPISIGQSYFDESVSLIIEFGIKLHQVVWRKLMPNEIEKAAQELYDISYKFLCSNNNDLCSKMSRFALEELRPSLKGSLKLLTTINKATAEKNLGQKKAAIKTIAKEDWTFVEDKYKLCVMAIREEHDNLIDAIPRAYASGSIGIVDLVNWPVFKSVRSDKKFFETIEKLPRNN